MCRFCKNWNTPCRNLQLGDVIIVGCAKYTRVGDGAERGVPMLYCPNCGDRMGGDNFCDSNKKAE